MVLSTDQLSKNYGKIKAIDNLSLQIERGSVHGVLGPNGSGKTTLLGTILNVIQASSGSYKWFDGMPLKQAHKKMGALLEYPNFYHYMSGYDNLRICADIKQRGLDNIENVLQHVGLSNRQHDKFRNYSLGMKQRLALAACLLNEPEVLVLDEPTNGLDPQGIAEVRAIIKNIAQNGTTIIIASHLLDEVEKVCTDVTILKNGQNIYNGSVKDLGSDKGVIEVANNDLDSLEAALRSINGIHTIKREGAVITLVCSDGYDSQNLSRDLSSRDIFLSHLEIRKNTLEKNFMELLQQKK